MMMLEALIALVIFSIGILGIMALQASAIKLSGDAKYRSDASKLASDLIGQMWVSVNRANAANIPTNLNAMFGHINGAALACNPGTPSYRCWYENVAETLPGLNAVPQDMTGVACPGGVPATTNNAPTVCVDTTAGANFGQVTVTIYWATQAEIDSGIRHSYVAQAQIK